MNSSATLAPSPISAPARPFGRLPFGFGSRFFVALLLGLAWLLPAWWSPRWAAAMFLWDGLFLLAWAADLLRLPRPARIHVSRVWKSPPALSVAGSVEIELNNRSLVAIRCVALDETPLSLRLDPPALDFVLSPGAASKSSYSILPAERGDTRVGRLYLRYRTSLGFAERRAVADLAQTVRVLPNIEMAKQQALYLIRSRQVEFEKRRRRERGIGREFDALRDYRPGDEPRDICWTATARHRRLITRIFQIERSQGVWLVLDAGRLLRAQVSDPGKMNLSKLDYAVNAALSLAQVALQCGDQVGLLAYGRRVQQRVSTGRGSRQIRAIVDSLAQVRAEAGEADHGRAVRALLAAQKRRCLVVWITDFAETATVPEVIEYAMQMTPRHLVVFAAMGQPDLAALGELSPSSVSEMYRHVAAREIIQRRDLLLRGLRQRGVLALELMPNMLAGTLVNQYLEVKDRNLI